MRVRDCMSPDPVTVRLSTPIGEARRLLNAYGIRHLPVVANDRLLGIVSDLCRPEARALADDRLNGTPPLAPPDAWLGGPHGDVLTGPRNQQRRADRRGDTRRGDPPDQCPSRRGRRTPVRGGDHDRLPLGPLGHTDLAAAAARVIEHGDARHLRPPPADEGTTMDDYAARDRHGTEILDYATCLELLGGRAVGRVAFVDAGTPMIVPVNYALDGTAIVFRSAIGAKLDAAERGHAVAFEIDDHNPAAQTGWSVVATGITELVDDPGDVERLDARPVESWALTGANATTWVRLRTDTITGRRVAPPS
jgi:nitroimidazol reductase NimA-like FMN-containing flavoprotein (pyridoxamine 5'-phosphate oxidase superfamily)